MYKFFGTILGFFSNICGGSYLLGLLLFALMIKIILLPFGIKQQKNSVRQAKMRPKEEAIRRKYKGRNDQKTQQKMQQEIMEMYQAEGYNPAGGCLPMLVQLIIIILLYQVIIYPLRYVVGMDASLVNALNAFSTASVENGGLGIVFSGRYTEISLLGELSKLSGDALTSFTDGFKAFVESSADYQANAATLMTGFGAAIEKGLPNFDLFGMQNFLAGVPSFKTAFKSFAGFMLFLIPILNFGVSFVSGKLTKKFTYQPMQQSQQANPTMKIMEWFGPLMSLWIAFIAPAALGLYWIFNTILGVLQQFILYKAMPIPVCTEEDVKAAIAELKGKGVYEKEVEEDVGSARSPYLEDFDDEDDAAVSEDEDDDDDDMMESRPSIVEPAKPKDSGSDKKKGKKNNKYE